MGALRLVKPEHGAPEPQGHVAANCPLRDDMGYEEWLEVYNSLSVAHWKFHDDEYRRMLQRKRIEERRLKQIEMWTLRAGVERRYRGFDFSPYTWPKPVEHAVSTWLKQFLDGEIAGANSEASPAIGKGLLFYGPPGSGKTTLENRIVLEVISSSARGDVKPVTPFIQSMNVRDDDRFIIKRPVYITRMADLLEIHKATFNAHSWDDEELTEFQEIVKGVTAMDNNKRLTISLLVLDDVGTENKTEWAVASLENIVRKRFQLGLPTIISTNLTPEQWSTQYSERMGSFIQEAFCLVPVKSPAGDRRRRSNA